ncbi:MAG TPA: Clp protease N-terminal domain-containing protein [Acidimicrobiales bacterium]|jgi:ATP-dependent Clp protease ATP-binding subunit ClpC|nr:Clp protease N-terminal domain-containing protein [Acidimicrobiales bacterium]
MFERFTDRARSVLVLAQQEARQLQHSAIGTEHLLLGLIHEDGGVAAKALLSLDISLEAVREGVEEVRASTGENTGQDEIPTTGSPAFTRRAKTVLEFALREALQLGHSYIGTEHILLGLVREGEGVGAQVLRHLGADLSSVRQQVIQLLSGYAVQRPAGEEVGASQAVRRLGPEGPTSMLPTCPQCRAHLAEAARFRVMTVAPGPTDRDKDSISIDVVYCSRCGVALEMFKSEPPSRPE